MYYLLGSLKYYVLLLWKVLVFYWVHIRARQRGTKVKRRSFRVVLHYNRASYGDCRCYVRTKSVLLEHDEGLHCRRRQGRVV